MRVSSAAINKPVVVFLFWILVVYVTMVYGPNRGNSGGDVPTRIRYTSMSLPYHIGTGWFGGFLPTTAFCDRHRDLQHLLRVWYPVIITLVAVVVGTIYVKETKDVDISADAGVAGGC